MGLFADTCDRCGQKTRHKHEDRPVCETCEQEMDGMPMTKTVAHMLVVDRCPKCNGVWLDGGELEKLYSDVSDEALVQMGRAIWG
jgi:hypothetical protein